MATILVTTDILDGNLGDGWSDNYASALDLAEFTKRIWLNDLRGFAADGHEIEIDIDVARNTSGASRGVSVNVDGLDVEAASDLEQTVLSSITDENRIWETFCGSVA